MTDRNIDIAQAYAELERGVYTALETYSNVHRGSGHNSMVSTHLYEQARVIVLDYLGLKNGKYTVLFCSPRRAQILKKQLKPDSYQSISSKDLGLSIGLVILAVITKALPKGTPFQTGGGTTKLMSKTWIIWADAPDKFEAGTPAIVNVIAFARALLIIRKYGTDTFKNSDPDNLTATEILYHDELDAYSGNELFNYLRQTLIGKKILVPTMKGLRPFINLDNSASTRTFEPVWNACRQTWHLSMNTKQQIIQEVKSICARALIAPLSDYDVIFTSNTTESINLVAESLNRGKSYDNELIVLNSLLEHSSNDLPWKTNPVFSLIRLSVNADGFIDLKELETLLSTHNQKNPDENKKIKLVAVSGASNVLGVCNKIEEISRIVHQYGAQLLVDAAQLVAHCSINMKGYGIDYLAFSAHKVYAPFGCGVLIVRKGLLNFDSDEMERIESSGEENAGGIAALGKTLLILQRIGMDLIRKEEQVLTVRVLQEMSKIKNLTVYGIKDPESPDFNHKIGVIGFIQKNMMSDSIAKALALRNGIGIRYGCHCAHIIIKKLLKISPFLERFQRFIVTLFPGLKLPGIARVSLGIENTEEDVDSLIGGLRVIAGQAQTMPDNHVYPADRKNPGLTKKKVKQQINNYVKAKVLEVYSLH